jgi:hypothetical protein
MAHCPITSLRDLAGCLDQVRGWPDVREPRPGVFYVKRTAFLHFHVGADGARWADVRDGATWREGIAIGARPGAAERRRFLRIIHRCYRTTVRSLGVRGTRVQPAARVASGGRTP